MLSDLDVRTTSNGNGIDSSSLESLSLLLREQQQRHRDNIRGGGGGDVNTIYRSGSAPPTVEGSLNAVGSLSRNSNGNGHGHDEDIRSHPAYIAYYYSHDHLNPRLPPPLLSREDWRASQRFDRNSNSLFSLQPGVGDSQHAAEAEWIEKDTDGLIGLAGVGLGARRKSLADMLQEGLGRPTPKSCRLSRPSSCNTFGDVLDPLAVSDPHLSRLHNKSESLDGLHSGPAGSGMIRVQSLGSSLSQSFASAMGSSLSRSTTPEATIIGRSTASNLPPLGGRVLSDKKSAIGSNIYNGLSSGVDDVVDISDALSELSLSKSRLIDKNNHASSKFETELKAQSSYPFDSPNNHIHTLQQHLINNSGPKVPTVSTIYEELAKSNETEARTDLNVSKINVDEQTNLPRRVSGNLLTKVSSSGSLSLDGSDLHQRNTETHNINLSGFDPGGYYINQRFSTSMTNHLDTGATTISSVGQNLGRSMNYVDPGFQLSVVDPLYVQYLQRPSDFRSQPSDSSLRRSYIGTPDLELIALQKTYLATLIAQQKQQYNMSVLDRADGFDHGVYRSPTYGVGLPNPIHPTVGSGIHIQQDEGISRFPSSLRSSIGGSIENWPTVNGGTVRERFASLLDEFKNNKTRCFELLEIVDHVVEFSGDQYGSRFIQQKLETASVEEKNKIFPKIIPHARTLMTDVFGNYVIQKFFEHGTESQRQELAGQLTGHVLPLSLQMYGCRVIQKALEVVDVDQQTQMVAELDGSIMKCVRDQNGNHVIQKCIECVPQDRIHFIVSSFYGQVVALSTHPYGCRVIQRVLEHCDDPDTQHIIMEEILRSVCTLAQDQYGNYVVQHILQHGQPLERSTIIKKLAGQIVKMSQQKFASNVVEKCLTFGGLEERQVLVTEMLGSTDENEPLQVMMKDPYGNYVVQKVLETCDNHSRELILSRIKVHLNTLKKYTYGKHIVARVEKLITTGERRMGFSPSFSS